MAEQSEKTPAPDLEKIRREARDQGSTDAVGRLGELQAAFPDDQAFAVEQFKAGKTVEEAKVAYNDVLTEKLADSQAKNNQLTEQLDKTKAAADKATAGKKASDQGAEPVVSEGEGGGGSADFMTTSRELAKTEGISKTEAMRRTARENPELHAAYTASQPAVSRK